MLYLDANVFCYAVLDSGPKGVRAAELLRSVVAGELDAVTSVLTWDEVVWALTDDLERSGALAQGDRLLSLPNLRIAPASKEEILLASRLMGEHERLDPRDAIHVATAIRNGAKAIVTDDAGIPGIKEMPRQSIG